MIRWACSFDGEIMSWGFLSWRRVLTLNVGRRRRPPRRIPGEIDRFDGFASYFERTDRSVPLLSRSELPSQGLCVAMPCTGLTIWWKSAIRSVRRRDRRANRGARPRRRIGPEPHLLRCGSSDLRLSSLARSPKGFRGVGLRIRRLRQGKPKQPCEPRTILGSITSLAPLDDGVAEDLRLVDARARCPASFAAPPRSDGSRNRQRPRRAGHRPRRATAGTARRTYLEW